MRQALALALLLSVACKSPATKAAKARDELASWAATGEMLSREWSHGRAHTPYVKSTAKVASDEIEGLRQNLHDDRAIGEVSALYTKLSDAVERQNRSSAARLAEPFSRIGKQIKPQ